MSVRQASTSRRSARDKLRRPRPRVEPNYKVERSWLAIIVASAPGLLLACVLALIGSDGALVPLGVLFSFLSSFFGAALRGNYYLAVELVNSADVEEWAYNKGIAVMALPGGVIAILDTRSRELYLSREHSLQRYPLIDRRSARFRVVVFHTRAIDLKERKAEILRGFVEGPSIKSEREWMRVSGAFLRAKLKFKDVGAQVRGLIEGLKEV